MSKIRIVAYVKITTIMNPDTQNLCEDFTIELIKCVVATTFSSNSQ